MRQNVYFLVRAGVSGDVLRQPKQCRIKDDVIVSEDRGVTLAQVGGRVVLAKMFIFYFELVFLGTFSANKNSAGPSTT